MKVTTADGASVASKTRVQVVSGRTVWRIAVISLRQGYSHWCQGIGGEASILNTLPVGKNLIFQAVVPDRLMARLFAVADTAGSWAIAISFVTAGALVAAVGTRALFVIAGTGALVLWVASAIALRSHWPRAPAAEPSPAAPVAAEA